MGSARENAIVTTNSSSAPQTQDFLGSTKSTKSTDSTETTETTDFLPRKVSRLEYVGAPPRPAYPSRAMKWREQGSVVVRVVIDRAGHVSNAAVWQSSGSAALDRSALLAVQTTRFKPYQENGVAKRATADIPFNFVLNR
jgi:protein TonB